MNDLSGTLLARRYEVKNLLGRGGMADVYRVFDRLRAVEMAIKVVREEYLDDPELLARFRKEAEALTRLQHPNVLRLYGLEQDGGLLFMVMDLADGDSLSALLRGLAARNERVPIGQGMRIGVQMGRALAYVHQLGYVHRDIKPSNMLLTRYGDALLSDLGIVQFRDEVAMTHTGTVLGTIHYMSPEQCTDSHQVDARSDIYSLGVTLFELLAGRRPFIGDRSQRPGGSRARVADEQINFPPPSLREFNPYVPPELDAIILQTMAKRREDRPQTALGLVAALEPYADARPGAILLNPPTAEKPASDPRGFYGGQGQQPISDPPRQPPSDPPRESPVCPSCRRVNRPESRFCLYCGTALTAAASNTPTPGRPPHTHVQVPQGPAGGTFTGSVSAGVVCPACRHVNRPGSRFCRECGRPLAPDGSGTAGPWSPNPSGGAGGQNPWGHG